jgi:hypothetical protein
MKIFYRTTENKAGKFRPDWFSYDACFKNFKSVFGNEDVTVFFDGETPHEYLADEKIVKTQCGSETKSFRNLLEYIKDQKYDDDEIIYIVEDDYLHREGALEILKDIFESTNIDYATLYDSPEKYFHGYYDRFATGFNILLVNTEKCHWRTTPSTTNTFATRYKTLMDDFDTHIEFSRLDEKTSRDHEKFHALWNKGRSIVSSIPGYSTHVENMLLSPCFDWEALSRSV